MPCSNSPTFAVGSFTAMLCSDQGRAAGVQYYVESLSLATPKGSLGRSRDSVASGGCNKAPRWPCSKAEGSTFFCPSHPFTSFNSDCCAHAANNFKILTALFTSKCALTKHFHSQHLDNMRLLRAWSLKVCQVSAKQKKTYFSKCEQLWLCCSLNLKRN